MSKQMKGTICTMAGATLWGINSVAGKFVMGVKGVDPVWMVTLRLLTAGCVLLAIAAIKKNRILDIWKEKWAVERLFVVAIFAFAICQATYFMAVHHSNAGISTAIQQTSPIFVLLWVLFSEKRLPKRVEVAVLAMVVFGAFLLSTGGNPKALVIPFIALVCGLISAVTCAMYTLLPGKLVERFGTFPSIGWGMILAGIVLIPVARFWNVSGTWDAQTVVVFAFIVTFGTVSAFALYLYGVTQVGVVRGSVYGLLEPVVSTVASAVILHQAFSMTDILGMIIILGGVTILSIFKS